MEAIDFVSPIMDLLSEISSQASSTAASLKNEKVDRNRAYDLLKQSLNGSLQLYQKHFSQTDFKDILSRFIQAVTPAMSKQVSRQIEKVKEGILKDLALKIESVHSHISLSMRDAAMGKELRDNFDQLQDFIFENQGKIEMQLESIKSDTQKSLQLQLEEIPCLRAKIDELYSVKDKLEARLKEFELQSLNDKLQALS